MHMALHDSLVCSAVARKHATPCTMRRCTERMCKCSAAVATRAQRMAGQQTRLVPQLMRRRPSVSAGSNEGMLVTKQSDGHMSRPVPPSERATRHLSQCLRSRKQRILLLLSSSSLCCGYIVGRPSQNHGTFLLLDILTKATQPWVGRLGARQTRMSGETSAGK